MKINRSVSLAFEVPILCVDIHHARSTPLNVVEAFLISMVIEAKKEKMTNSFKFILESQFNFGEKHRKLYYEVLDELHTNNTIQYNGTWNSRDVGANFLSLANVTQDIEHKYNENNFVKNMKVPIREKSKFFFDPITKRTHEWIRDRNPNGYLINVKSTIENAKLEQAILLARTKINYSNIILDIEHRQDGYKTLVKNIQITYNTNSNLLTTNDGYIDEFIEKNNIVTSIIKAINEEFPKNLPNPKAKDVSKIIYKDPRLFWQKEEKDFVDTYYKVVVGDVPYLYAKKEFYKYGPILLPVEYSSEKIRLIFIEKVTTEDISNKVFSAELYAMLERVHDPTIIDIIVRKLKYKGLVAARKYMDNDLYLYHLKSIDLNNEQILSEISSKKLELIDY